ncbi:MFS transporter [Streptomyces sp. NBC_01198]|uniref:MFS transporter n=1 Tax=Streptomyces sp. NBC_01198 TaxID=2903769 RepID=UPI002E0F4C65|nr:MFS transporter [Streptomyces sp. NBC_01198]
MGSEGAVAPGQQARQRGGRGLVRYFLAALLVRGADSGATVGVVLLALNARGHPGGGAAAGGLLAAALSAPHLFGPWLAHRLDRARDGRRLLAAAFVLYAVALACTAVAVGRVPLGVALCTTAVAGCCGPLLTGGLSSRLAALAGRGERPQRRAQGWDAMTYGLGGTLGPAVVAGAAVLTGPRAALLALCLAAAAAAGFTLALPPDRAGARGPAAVPGVREGLTLLVSHPALRRVTLLTLISALELGALPVIATTYGPHLSHHAAAGAVLTTALGLGNLAGSLLVTVVPLRGEPEIWARRLFAVLAGTTVLAACAPGYSLALAGFALVGVANSLSFTSTLASRSAYAPPGARAQIFVTSAGLKVALASVGTAVAGAAAGLGGRALLLMAAGATTLAVLVALADRLATSDGPAAPSATAGRQQAPGAAGAASHPADLRTDGGS